MENYANYTENVVNDAYVYKDITPKIHNNKLIGYNSSYDVEAVKNSLKNLFLVQRGEIPGKPQIGNTLNVSLFDNFNFFTESDLKQSLKSQIEKYEPRAKLIDINISEMPEYNRIVIEVIFSVNLKEGNIIDNIYLPFSSNDHTYLGGRQITQF